MRAVKIQYVPAIAQLNLGGKRTEWTNMISWVNIKFPHTGT
jgi:hypothetical protein